MAEEGALRPTRNRRGRYPHGALRRALLEEALRTIGADGVEHLTLRAVGAALGVSRSALYRHFADKQALLAAVAREGFRVLRESLVDAWDAHGHGRAGFEAMGIAYVHFAMTHPSHYRVMFGRFLEDVSRDARLAEEARGAFQVLVDAIVEQQRDGLVRDDDPLMMARFIWSLVHGIAMLEIDGRFTGERARGGEVSRYAVQRIRRAIEKER